MIVPPSDPVREKELRMGSWVDLLDSDGRILFRRTLHLPLQQSVEVFSPEPGQTPYRINPPGHKGVFVVVIPDSDEGIRVALYHVPPISRTPTESDAEPRYYALKW